MMNNRAQICKTPELSNLRLWYVKLLMNVGDMGYLHIGQDFIKRKKVRRLNESEISACRQFFCAKSKSNYTTVFLKHIQVTVRDNGNLQ